MNLEILLSGLIGVFIGSLLSMGFTIWRDKNTKKLNLAREKLEKVYGPLVALKKKNKEINGNGVGFMWPSNPMEKEMIEKIIFHYYHLVDDDLKEDIILLHPELSRQDSGIVKMNISKTEDKIVGHYKENKKILRMK